MMKNKSATRIERDSLGEVFVPSNALYGAQTQRAIENFPISGLKPRQAFIWSMGIIKKVTAQVNMDLGLLDTEKANGNRRRLAQPVTKAVNIN
jgi:fumarate hydratase class II